MTFAAVDQFKFPFVVGEWCTLGELRAVTGHLLIGRRSNPPFSAKLRTQRRTDLPWAKAWNEEFFPLKLLADHMKLADADSFMWTPDGPADFTIGLSSGPLNIQCTMAYPEWPAAAGKPPGQIHYLEMKQYNETGRSYGGGLISEPHAREAEEDVRAWQAGINSAVLNKLRPKYAGTHLLVYVPRCQFDTIDFSFSDIVGAAVREVPDWKDVFKGLYILDAPEGAFFEITREMASNTLP